MREPDVPGSAQPPMSLKRVVPPPVGRPPGWSPQAIAMAREAAVHSQLDLAAVQTDVGELPVVEGRELADGDPAPPPAGTGLDDRAADRLRQAHDVWPEHVGDDGAVPCAGGVWSRDVPFSRRSSARRAFVQTQRTPFAIASACRRRASAVLSR